MSEPADVWSELRARARRPWVCVGCRHPICPGTEYLRVGCCHDGEWSTLRAHLECHELARHLVGEDRLLYLEDLRGQLGDRRHCDSPERDCDDLRRWRAVLRARLREQRGRASVCAHPPRETCTEDHWLPWALGRCERADRPYPSGCQ